MAVKKCKVEECSGSYRLMRVERVIEAKDIRMDITGRAVPKGARAPPEVFHRDGGVPLNISACMACNKTARSDNNGLFQ